MAGFSQQIKRLNSLYKKRLRVTAKESIQETVSLAQRVRKQGGRMRVKTGFLRASIQAGIGQMPSGPTVNEDGKEYPLDAVVAGEPVSATLLKWDPNKGSVLFVGWTANYARHREHKDGFLRGATELWDQTVERAAIQAKSTIA